MGGSRHRGASSGCQVSHEDSNQVGSQTSATGNSRELFAKTHEDVVDLAAVEDIKALCNDISVLGNAFDPESSVGAGSRLALGFL